jgi:CotH kinase protein
MKQLLVMLWLCLAMGLLGMGQNGEQLFDDAILHEIRLELELHQNWLDTLLKDYTSANQSPDSIPEVYRRATTATIDGFALAQPIGIKLRGNFSAGFNILQRKRKFPFKLSFNEFIDQQYDGLKKVNLNTNTNDPSFVHEKLTYGMLRELGQPAPRTAYAKLYVNGDYVGLYMLVENLDKTFLKYNYGSSGNDGNLYRSLTCPLVWRGYDKEAYKDEMELKTNESTDDWSRFIALLDIVNNAPQDEMVTKLSAIFDIDNYLKVVAIERLVFSWDSYSAGGANYSLYERADGKIAWIPWDYNETFQASKALIPQSYLVPKLERTLLKAIFEQPQWRAQYLDVVCEILHKGTFSVAHLSPKVYAWHTLIDEAYREEPNPLFPYADFKATLFDELSEVAKFPQNGIQFNILRYEGLFTFIKDRIRWSARQMQLQDYDCAFHLISEAYGRLDIYPNPARGDAAITVANQVPVAGLYNRVRVYNSAGVCVQATDWRFEPTGSRTFVLEELAPGIYFIAKMDVDGRCSTGKLIVR